MGHRSQKIRSITGLCMMLLASSSVLAGSKVYTGQRCSQKDRPSLALVDHSGYDALLRKYVDTRGMVDYGRWKANAEDRKALGTYLVRLGCVDRRKRASRSARLAFWINAYNALTLHGILREYPTTSIRNHTSKTGGYNIWNDLYLWVDSSVFSLNDIEHKILRKMGEPRIHFAVVCASRGCPPLLNRAYTAKKLDNQLTANARRFFADPTNFQADARNCTVSISKLIQWYGRDFAPTTAEQMKQLRTYFPNSDRLGWMDRCRVKVQYLDYDWTLNAQKPRSR